MGTLHLHLGGSHSRDGEEFHLAERAQLCGDSVLCGDGAERVGGVRSAAALRGGIGSGMDNSRGRVLHHGCLVLLSATAAFHAHRVPLLRAGRKRVPHRGGVGHTDAMAVEKKREEDVSKGNLKEVTASP